MTRVEYIYCSDLLGLGGLADDLVRWREDHLAAKNIHVSVDQDPDEDFFLMRIECEEEE